MIHSFNTLMGYYAEKFAIRYITAVIFFWYVNVIKRINKNAHKSIIAWKWTVNGKQTCEFVNGFEIVNVNYI